MIYIFKLKYLNYKSPSWTHCAVEETNQAKTQLCKFKLVFNRFSLAVGTKSSFFGDLELLYDVSRVFLLFAGPLLANMPQYGSMEPVGTWYSTTSRTSPLPSPHLDKRFFDCSLIEMKSQASSSSTLDYDSMDEIWVKRNEASLTPETVRRKKVSL